MKMEDDKSVPACVRLSDSIHAPRRDGRSCNTFLIVLALPISCLMEFDSSSAGLVNKVGKFSGPSLHLVVRKIGFSWVAFGAAGSYKPDFDAFRRPWLAAFDCDGGE